MGKRTKPQALVIADLAQAEGVLAELAEIDRSLELAKAAMNEEIDGAKATARAAAEPLEARRKELVIALEAFATHNKAALFAKKKSLDLGFGVIGFRLASRLKTVAKTTWGQVLEALKSYGFTEAIRVKEEVDRDVMRDWPAERLATVGVTRETADDFYIEIKQEEVASKAA